MVLKPFLSHFKGIEATGWIRGFYAVCVGFSLFFAFSK
jgi:hypothetical protein